MKIIGKQLAIGALAGLLSLGTSRSGVAQMADTAEVITIETVDLQLYRAKEPNAVPAPKAEAKPASPGGKAIWVPGFWTLQANRYTAPRAGWVWVPGRWLTPPAPKARWEPAHWGMLDEWWSWIPGHWVVPGRYGYPPDLATAKQDRLRESQEDQQ
jgi:hypothetical protein